MARSPRVRPVDGALTPGFARRGGGWSAPLPGVGGGGVRVHVSLAVTVTVALVGCWHAGIASAWVLLGVYLLSLGAHELAHLSAAGRLRGVRASLDPPEPIVLGALGGVAIPSTGPDPRERVFVAMAGPLANLALVVAALFLIASYETAEERVGAASSPLLVAPLFFDPVASLAELEHAPAGRTFALAVFAVNWSMFLLNLLPAAPFDAAAALRAWLRLWVARRAADELTRTIGLLAGAGMLGASVALSAAEAAPAAACAVLGGLAVVTLFGARSTGEGDLTAGRWGADIDGPEGVALDGLPAPPSPGRVREPEEVVPPTASGEGTGDGATLDDVLAKVHVAGLDSLSPAERRLLEDASRRFRRRRGLEG